MAANNMIYKPNIAYVAETAYTKTASTDLKIDISNVKDSRLLLIVSTTATTGGGTLTFKRPDVAKTYASDTALSIYDNSSTPTTSLTAGKTYYLFVDTARVKQLSGDDKGKLVINGTSAGTIAVVQLP